MAAYGDFFIALDWGLKKVGYASADPMGMIVTPRGHFKRSKTSIKWTLNTEDLKSIEQILEKHEAGHIVLGFPLLKDGQLGPEAVLCQEFAKTLETQVACPIHLVNEHLSTWSSRGEQDDDAGAASVILRDFFSQRERTKNNNE